MTAKPGQSVKRGVPSRAQCWHNIKHNPLLPSTSKVVDIVIFYQLYTDLETNDIFYGSQYGFRKIRLTEFVALELVDKLLNIMDKGPVPLGIVWTF